MRRPATRYPLRPTLDEDFNANDLGEPALHADEFVHTARWCSRANDLIPGDIAAARIAEHRSGVAVLELIMRGHPVEIGHFKELLQVAALAKSLHARAGDVHAQEHWHQTAHGHRPGTAAHALLIGPHSGAFGVDDLLASGGLPQSVDGAGVGGVIVVSHSFAESRVYLTPAEHVDLEVVTPIDSNPLSSPSLLLAISLQPR